MRCVGRFMLLGGRASEAMVLGPGESIEAVIATAKCLVSQYFALTRSNKTLGGKYIYSLNGRERS